MSALEICSETNTSGVMTSCTDKKRKIPDITHKLAEKRRDRVFIAFDLYYDALWLDKFDRSEGEAKAIMRMWGIALRNVGDDAVEKAIDAILTGRSDFSKYPPKSGEFVELCKRHTAVRYRDMSELIPKIEGKCTPEVREENMRKIREALWRK